MESNATVLSALKELIEICRVKCSPLDEVILPNGRTNHEALVSAVQVAEEAEQPEKQFIERLDRMILLNLKQLKTISWYGRPSGNNAKLKTRS
jgi:hypothetical protein